MPKVVTAARCGNASVSSEALFISLHAARLRREQLARHKDTQLCHLSRQVKSQRLPARDMATLPRQCARLQGLCHLTQACDSIRDRPHAAGLDRPQTAAVPYIVCQTLASRGRVWRAGAWLMQYTHTHTQPTKHERTAWLAVGWLVGWPDGCALWSVCLFVSVGVTVSVRPIVAGRHARPIEREIDVVLTVESAVDVMSESASK